MKAINDTLIKRLLKQNILKVRKNGHVVGQKLDIHGYFVVIYKGKNLKAHRIAYQHFYGDLKPTMQVNHKNGNKRKNNKENLEQITKSENIKHMFQTVKRKRLSFRQATNIRALYGTGLYSQTFLAKKYRCSTRYIQHITANTRHVE